MKKFVLFMFVLILLGFSYETSFSQFRTRADDEKKARLEEVNRHKSYVGKHFFAHPTSDLVIGRYPFYKGEHSGKESENRCFGVDQKIGFTIIGFDPNGFFPDTYKVKFDNGVIANITVFDFFFIKNHYRKITEK